MRVFLAIDFPENIKEKIIRDINPLKQEFPELKWVKSPSLHLTLKFLGETDPSKIAEMNSVLENAFNSIDPFQLITTKSQLLPTPIKARVLYLGLEQSGQLVQCYNIIERKIKSMGFERENRNFRPHITLARIKNRKLSESESAAILSHSFSRLEIEIKELVLMQSELLRDGARYTAVQRFSLRSI